MGETDSISIRVHGETLELLRRLREEVRVHERFVDQGADVPQCFPELVEDRCVLDGLPVLPKIVDTGVQEGRGEELDGQLIFKAGESLALRMTSRKFPENFA